MANQLQRARQHEESRQVDKELNLVEAHLSPEQDQVDHEDIPLGTWLYFLLVKLSQLTSEDLLFSLLEVDGVDGDEKLKDGLEKTE